MDALQIASSLTETEILVMSKPDIADVLEIERVSFPSPWSRSSFEDILTREYSRAYVIKATYGGRFRVIGYICLWMFLDEIHILNLAIHSEFRRQSLGEKLLKYALNLAQRRGIRWATLEVRQSNHPAIALYKKMGFKSVRLRPRYYMDNREDAVVMEKAIEKGGNLYDN